MKKDMYPLQFLASCKEKDAKKCADITEKLFMNYDDILLRVGESNSNDNSSVLAVAADNNNLQFLNLYHKKQISNQQRIINALEHKVEQLQVQIEKKYNNHEKMNIFPHLFVIVLSCIIFFLLKITFI